MSGTRQSTRRSKGRALAISKQFILMTSLAGTVALAQDATQYRVAYLNKNQIFVLHSNSVAAAQITDNADSSQKLWPRWSPDGDRLAYISTTASVATLTVVSQKGEKIASHVLFRGHKFYTDDEILVPRDLSIDSWAGSSAVALEGSFNPYRCGFWIIDVVSGKVLRESGGACRSFQLSPDARHVLARGVTPGVEEEKARDSVWIDENVSYPFRNSDVKFVSPCSWSPDGRTVAVVESVVSSAEKNLVLVDTGGKSSHIALPKTFGSTGHVGRPSWFGDRILVSDDTFSFGVGYSDGRLSSQTSGDAEVVSRAMLRSDASETIKRNAAVKAGMFPGADDLYYDVWVRDTPSRLEK